MLWRVWISSVMLVALAPSAAAQTADTAQLRLAIQARVDSFRLGARAPGISVAVALADGRVIAVASGMADTARGVALTPAALMPQGSVGKTYYAALAMQLAEAGTLDLDAPASRYLGERPWWRRMPNADSIRVRHLLNHTSGVMRYEFKDAFTQALTRDPYRTWPREELLSYVFDERAAFTPGNGWDYSDTNYMILGLIIESLIRRPLQHEVQRRFLGPLGLRETVPDTSPAIPGVVQGYAGPNNPFGGSDAVIGADGRMTFNPDFEWAGGGYSSTAADLARWAHLLYGGRAIGAAALERMVTAAVPAPMLGARYGYGVIVIDSIRGMPELGGSRGHSGFFPGYVTEMRWFTRPRIAVVVMANSSAPGAFARGRGPARLANEVGALVAASLAPDSGAVFRRLFERWVPWPVDAAELRLVAEYGAAVAAADDSVQRPPTIWLAGSAAGDSLRRRLRLDSLRSGAAWVVLQRPALLRLAAARRAARERGLTLTPRGGRAASLRGYDESLEYWQVRVAAGLRRAVAGGALTPAAADSIARLPARRQLAPVLALEDRGFRFGMNGARPILRSAAAPGASQHMVGYAIDVEEHAQPAVRQLLREFGFWQTVAEDEPHFTYLGPADSTVLQTRGLVRTSLGGRPYWVPGVPGVGVSVVPGGRR